MGGRLQKEKRFSKAAVCIVHDSHCGYGGEASYENVAALESLPLVQAADMIFAIGGGKALDTCKCLSVKTGRCCSRQCALWLPEWRPDRS